MWGQIAQAVSGAIQSKADYNNAKTMDVGDYGSAAQGTAMPQPVAQETKPVEQPTIDTTPQAEPEKEVKTEDSGSSPLDSMGAALSDEDAKDANKLSWDEKVKRINDVMNIAGSAVDKLKGMKSENTNTMQPVQSYNFGGQIVSDERAKNRERLEKLFGGDGAIDAFSKIDSYVYNYKKGVQDAYGGTKGVDGNTHFGPMAQDLASNPVTQGTVHKDMDTGYLEVDTKQLTLTNTAMISQLARKIQEIEERIGGRL